MTRILYVWQGAYPWDVRVEKFCRAFVEERWKVLLLARWRGEENRSEQIDGIHIERVGLHKPKTYSIPISQNPVWRKAIKNSVELFKPDLIIAREIMLAEASAEIGHKFDIPVIMDMAEHYPAVIKGWRKYRNNPISYLLIHKLNYPELIEKNSVSLMNGIITVCLEQKQRLIDEYIYSDDLITIVHNTPDLSMFELVRTGCDSPPKIFSYQGTVNYERNLIPFIKGFILAARKLDDIKLVIAGFGEELNTLKKIALTSGVSNRIFLTGAYHHSKLVEFYSEMDVGFLPYKINLHINNTISNKLFDYMAAGKPVIVSEALPMGRIINEAKCGIVTDCSNDESVSKAIFKIRNSDVKMMSQNGQNIIHSKYNWAKDRMNLINFVNQFI